MGFILVLKLSKSNYGAWRYDFSKINMWKGERTPHSLHKGGSTVKKNVIFVNFVIFVSYARPGWWFFTFLFVSKKRVLTVAATFPGWSKFSKYKKLKWKFHDFYENFILWDQMLGANQVFTFLKTLKKWQILSGDSTFRKRKMLNLCTFALPEVSKIMKKQQN